jgi:hypothetical protein
MKTWVIAGALATLGMLAACGVSITTPTEPIVTVVGDTTFVQLPVDSEVMVDAVSIHFDRVTEDSRCPFGVTCVWAGNGRIELTVSDGVDTQILGLNTDTPPTEGDFGGFTIRLDQLDPYPSAGRPTRPSSYAATIAVFP